MVTAPSTASEIVARLYEAEIHLDGQEEGRLVSLVLTWLDGARLDERERCLGIVLAKAHTERSADDTLQGAYRAAPYEALADAIRREEG